MNAAKIAAIVLILVGVFGLAYGSFSYTKETHEAKIGPLELSVKDKQTVNIPVWAGVGAIVSGGALLVLAARRDRSFSYSELTGTIMTAAAGAMVLQAVVELFTRA